ncbi:MAG: RagB/SusD family nutrient uptake outer membrane protein [Bacteroidia bacterium]|nr:RagB/SusD family nutrient uptake outer membrane protein [Bacteroidia bacterium]
MKTKIFLITGLIILLSNGCKKEFLEKEPYGPPSSNNFWKTSADAIAASNAIYASYATGGQFDREFFWYINASDDMVTGRIKSEPDNIKNFICTGNEGYTKSVWGNKYITIKRCNDVIANVPAMNIDEDLKNRILGEAHFICGWMYLDLAYHYGDNRAGVPIIDRADPTKTYIPRPANVGVNYDYCAEEFKKAAELLPYFDTYSVKDKGRAHKTAALAYLAKTYIYHAQYDAKYWAEAEKACNDVINSGKHALQSDFKDVFKIANNTGSEYVWSLVCSEREGSIVPGVLWENKGWGLYNGWGYWQPTKELFNEYETGDQRRDWTILKAGDVFPYFGAPFTWYQTSNNLTGYMCGKYREPFGYANPIGNTINSNGDEPTTKLWVPLLRYAEVILFKAEALLKQNKNADQYINMIRARAGLAPKTNATLNDLKHERRCELAFEWSDRHFDLVRWGDADAAYANALHGSLGQVVWPPRPQFNPAIHHVWPIPPAQIENSKGTLTQNEGW